MRAPRIRFASRPLAGVRRQSLALGIGPDGRDHDERIAQ